MVRRSLVLLAALTVLAAVAAPAQAAIWPSREQLPDGLARPLIDSVELAAPDSHNRLLEADLVIETTTDIGIASYEYRWVQQNYGTVHTTHASSPTVSFASVVPNARYSLDVRAIDARGWASDWTRAWSGITPSVPTVIVAGDSVASGYQRQWFTGSSTCRDAGYSYGSTAVDDISAALPPAWQPRYINIAWPGAGVEDVLSGGSDSCSNHYDSQVDQIVAQADPDSWTVAVITAGINSTNWVDVVTGLTKDTLFSLTDAGDKKACQEAVNEDWNLPERRDRIIGDAAAIVDQIHARSNAHVYWTSYYELAGTHLAPLWTPVGAECAEEMDFALAELHDTLRAGIGNGADWVDLGTVHVPLQKWAGWPHPNPEGHVAIGDAVAHAIVGWTPTLLSRSCVNGSRVVGSHLRKTGRFPLGSGRRVDG